MQLIDLKTPWLRTVFILVFVVGALWLLHRELAQYHLRDIENSLTALTWGQVALALGLTCLSYIVLVGYDWIGVRIIGQAMPLHRIALASFLGYSAVTTLAPYWVRRPFACVLYTAWGLSAIEIVKLLLMLTLTF